MLRILGLNFSPSLQISEDCRALERTAQAGENNNNRVSCRFDEDKFKTSRNPEMGFGWSDDPCSEQMNHRGTYAVRSACSRVSDSLQTQTWSHGPLEQTETLSHCGWSCWKPSTRLFSGEVHKRNELNTSKNHLRSAGFWIYWNVLPVCTAAADLSDSIQM